MLKFWMVGSPRSLNSLSIVVVVIPPTVLWVFARIRTSKDSTSVSSTSSAANCAGDAIGTLRGRTSRQREGGKVRRNRGEAFHRHTEVLHRIVKALADSVLRLAHFNFKSSFSRRNRRCLSQDAAARRARHGKLLRR